ncbi:hypothetical protein LAZ67_18000771 [Cordylochernes scorpioides]|uniref:Uncharacterized protein n=1 Tax=Cordylochernes scorpioides TaxID=51811 RepID=A0ABY6LK02_9ARAC|nr:hypothetical protein LAZ67_18000771 [Cordylochernes scorpioides]
MLPPVSRKAIKKTGKAQKAVCITKKKNLRKKEKLSFSINKVMVQLDTGTTSLRVLLASPPAWNTSIYSTSAGRLPSSIWRAGKLFLRELRLSLCTPQSLYPPSVKRGKYANIFYYV